MSKKCRGLNVVATGQHPAAGLAVKPCMLGVAALRTHRVQKRCFQCFFAGEVDIRKAVEHGEALTVDQLLHRDAAVVVDVHLLKQPPQHVLADLALIALADCILLLFKREVLRGRGIELHPDARHAVRVAVELAVRVHPLEV